MCKTRLVYCNDVTMFLIFVEAHLKHVADILRILAHANVSLKLLKCEMFCLTVTYLGHVAKPGRLLTKSFVIKSSKETFLSATNDRFHFPLNCVTFTAVLLTALLIPQTRSMRC